MCLKKIYYLFVFVNKILIGKFKWERRVVAMLKKARVSENREVLKAAKEDTAGIEITHFTVSNALTYKVIFSYIPVAKKGGSYQQYYSTAD